MVLNGGGEGGLTDIIVVFNSLESMKKKDMENNMAKNASKVPIVMAIVESCLGGIAGGKGAKEGGGIVGTR